MRAVLYARYSSTNQRAESIEDQLEVGRRFIAQQGWTLVRTYEDRADKKAGGGERRINEAEAAVVRRIFREFADGTSPRALAKRLNQEHVPGPGGRPWGDTTIRGQAERGTGILNNALYAGRLEW